MTGGPYTLPEVARMTGLSLRSIEIGCRAGRIEHTPRGEGTQRVHRVMYQHQIDALLAQRAASVAATNPTPSTPVDDLADARQKTRERLARRTGHRRVA